MKTKFKGKYTKNKYNSAGKDKLFMKKMEEYKEKVKKKQEKNDN